MQRTVRACIDGSCLGNPGPGAWAVVVADSSGPLHEWAGSTPATTNNRMELQAAIEALRRCACACPGVRVTLVTDSRYVATGAAEWLPAWKARGWRTAARQPVKNMDLWEVLDALLIELQPCWQWVQGHSGACPFHTRADALARETALAAASREA